MMQDNSGLSTSREKSNLSLLSEACFMLPDHTNLQSAWYGHVPFAFWIVDVLKPLCLVELGTHHGLSYLSFCQAIAQLRLSTAAYAIDTWKGDEHAGFYGDEVFVKLNELNDSRYSSFSRLVRATFDEAVDQFPDGSIELLHIDGLHSYEAVKHDFEAWRPKLASCAIVLFHDTNVRERDFGVWRLWGELAEKHPHFEFLHGHGLGVLGLGSGFFPAISALFAAASDNQAKIEVRNLFAGLGAQVSRQVRIEDTADETLHEISARDAQITQLSNEISARDSVIEDLRCEVIQHEAVNKVLMEQKLMRASRLKELKHNFSWRITRPLRSWLTRKQVTRLKKDPGDES